MKNDLKIKNPLALFLVLIVMSSCFSLVTLAEDHDNAQELVKLGEILPLETILQHVYKIEKGHILEVELELNKKRLVYEIELLNEQGIVTEYIFDAQTGDLLKQRIEH